MSRSPGSTDLRGHSIFLLRVLDRSAVLVHPDSRIISGADRRQKRRGKILSAAAQLGRSAVYIG